jgi:hypothetical protein
MVFARPCTLEPISKLSGLPTLPAEADSVQMSQIVGFMEGGEG